MIVDQDRRYTLNQVRRQVRLRFVFQMLAMDTSFVKIISILELPQERCLLSLRLLQMIFFLARRMNASVESF